MSTLVFQIEYTFVVCRALEILAGTRSRFYVIIRFFFSKLTTFFFVCSLKFFLITSSFSGKRIWNYNLVKLSRLLILLHSLCAMWKRSQKNCRVRERERERRERKVVEKIFSAFFHIFEQFDVHQSLAFEKRITFLFAKEPRRRYKVERNEEHERRITHEWM